MHQEGKFHGNISKNADQWIDSSGLFDSLKFRSTASDQEEDLQAGIQKDVRAFVASARTLIAGNSGSTEADFKANLYLNVGVPKAFLELLEITTQESGTQMRTMADFAATFTDYQETAKAPEDSQQNPPAEIQPVSLPSNTPISIALRNGTVGKPYEIEPSVIARAIATQRKEDPARARISHLQLPDDCGLHFNEQTGAVTGTPSRALEEQLQLDYVSAPNAASISCKVSLLINPDPASLWKDLAPPEDAPYAKESLDHGEFHFPDFRVVAASRRGRSHANKGDFRDDDFAVGYAESTGWLVIVVADGAGSAKYSRKGSQIACTVSRDWLVGTLNSPEYASIGSTPSGTAPEAAKPKKPLRDLLYDAARLAHFKIQDEAKAPSEPLPEPPTIRNYDTTLILLIMKKTPAGYLAASFSVGDGGAGILKSSSEVQPLTRADGGEHAGQTTFVTIASSLKDEDDNLTNRYSQQITPEFTAALAMTDGITDPKFPSDAAFSDPECWAQLWKDLEPALAKSESLLEWMNFFSPGNHDDRTLVAVLPSSNPSQE